MPDKFQNKYRIPSARLQNWDYGWNAPYFVTICTKDREHYFGEILDGEMQLSEIGQLVNQEWIKTPQIRPDMHLVLDTFVIMPNHFHAIIHIGENEFNTVMVNGNGGGNGRDAMHRVSTVGNKNTFAPQSKNLPSIIRGFKSAVTCAARKINPDFAWQSRYHDHIIRNDISFNRIAEYIQHNPFKWTDDKFYS
ncbi:hypothetical protein F0P94_09045 [Adhaeribacter soli]|uniref:Transposase IS200-like domain-containing protein n=2 Tax=Adhaeribacter soli TaxID=2607655 RepID=A0A5N1IX22_9BACT|nr:hypothetical protein F0P94_09045 [Adhaeribacter soli]